MWERKTIGKKEINELWGNQKQKNRIQLFWNYFQIFLISHLEVPLLPLPQNTSRNLTHPRGLILNHFNFRCFFFFFFFFLNKIHIFYFFFYEKQFLFYVCPNIFRLCWSNSLKFINCKQIFSPFKCQLVIYILFFLTFVSGKIKKRILLSLSFSWEIANVHVFEILLLPFYAMKTKRTNSYFLLWLCKQLISEN